MKCIHIYFTIKGLVTHSKSSETASDIIKEYSWHSGFHHRPLPYINHKMLRLNSYPDLDAGASGSTEPVTVGAEAQGIDGVPTVQGVEVLALIQVPQHGLAILDKENTCVIWTKLLIFTSMERPIEAHSQTIVLGNDINSSSARVQNIHFQ